MLREILHPDIGDETARLTIHMDKIISFGETPTTKPVDFENIPI